MTHYILLASSKGGTGKSTLCTQIATELVRLGYSVYAVDYDPQQHFARHIKRCACNYCDCEEVAEYVVIDTTGVLAAINASVFNAVKTEKVTVIVPFLLSYVEVREALRMLRFLKKYDLAHKTVFVVNKANKENEKDIVKYSRYLTKVGHVAKHAFTNRKAYRYKPDWKVRNEISRFLHTEVFNAPA